MTDSKVHFAVPITKATDGDDGTVFVEGLATTDDLDLDEQIIDKEFAFRGLTKWFTDWANIRQMHSPGLAPAGRAIEMKKHDNGIWLRVKVVEPTAVKLVKEGVYRAFSVGIASPRIGPHPLAKHGAVLDGIFSEVSLVDFPANPVCRFEMAKRASGTAELEIVEKVFGESGLNKSSNEGDSTDKTVETEVEKAEAVVPEVEAEEVEKAKGKFNADDPDGDGDDDEEADEKKPAAKKSVEDEDAVTKSGAPYHLVRLHDALCPAFADEDLLIAHPATVKGIQDQVSLEYFSGEITKALNPETMHRLNECSQAYQFAVAVKSSDRDAVEGELAELRKSFAEYYPDVHVVPGSITPGEFKRGFLPEANATEGGTPQGLGRPVEGNPPSHSDFNRDEVTDGRARAGVSKSAARQALGALHDYLSTHNPELCAVEQPSGMLSDGPHSVPAVKVQENNEEHTLTPVANPERVVTKAADVEAMVVKAFGDKLAKVDELVETIDALTKRVHELEAMPDPATVAVRNASASGQLKPKTETASAEKSEEAQRLVRLVKAARSYDSNISVPAYAKLINLVGPDNLAELMK